MTKAEHIARRREILRMVRESLDRLERTVPCVLDQIERDEDARWRRVALMLHHKDIDIRDCRNCMWQRESPNDFDNPEDSHCWNCTHYEVPWLLYYDGEDYLNNRQDNWELVRHDGYGQKQNRRKK